MNGDRPLIVCRGIAKARGLTSSGNRSTIGTVLNIRNNPWINGTAPGFCVGLSGMNSDVKLYDLVPITDETHECAVCTGKCLPKNEAAKRRKVIKSKRAKEKNIAQYTLYVSGYMKKPQQVPHLELRRSLPRMAQLTERHANSTQQTLGRAVSQRLLTDIETGGTRRGSVETQHLCINARHNDCLFAECIRTFKEVHVATHEWFKRLDGAETVTPVMNTEVEVVVSVVCSMYIAELS